MQDFLPSSQLFVFKLWRTENQFEQKAKRSPMYGRLAAAASGLFACAMQKHIYSYGKFLF